MCGWGSIPLQLQPSPFNLEPRGGAALQRGRAVPCSIRMQQQTGIFTNDMLNVDQGSRTYLVGADIRRNKYKTLESTWSVEDSLAELERLSETAGLVVVGSEYQVMQNPSPATFIGEGKLAEMVQKCKELEVTTVIFDEELSPAQGRNIQNALVKVCGEGVVKVLDRTMLILQIFAQRARTKEAKLQVSAAQMKYMIPRLQYFMTTGAGMDAKGGAGKCMTTLRVGVHACVCTRPHGRVATLAQRDEWYDDSLSLQHSCSALCGWRRAHIAADGAVSR